jgi:putative transcriptional regulator
MTGRVELTAGRMLLALPSLLDPNFARSVVYLLEHDPEAGSTGVVVNRPTRTPVGQVLPAWEDTMAEPGRGLSRRPGTAERCVVPGQDAGAGRPAPHQRHPGQPARRRAGRSRLGRRRGTQRRPSAARLRRVRGMVGRAVGVRDCPRRLVCRSWRRAEIFSADPETLWQRLWRREPYPASLLASYPENPTLN